MQTHELKIATEYFDAVASGEKNFEVRRDDRGFQRGDTLKLRRYGKCYPTKRLDYLRDSFSCPKKKSDTIQAYITYVLTGGQFGIEPGHVVLGLSNIERVKNEE